VAELPLEGKRVLVVGASSGIGRAFGVHAVRAGAAVVLAARRKDKLEEAAEEAGGAHVACGDVSDAGDCERIVSDAVAAVGGLDLLFYSVGYSPLRHFAETTVADWRAVLDANVVGAHQVIRAAVPHVAPGAIVAAVSSEAVGQPRSATGAYNASKAALEASLRSWRVEHPRIRFSCVAVGATVPTEFGSDFDPELLAASLDDWRLRGLVQEDYMVTDELAEVLVGMFAAALRHPGIGVEHLTLRSPSPVLGTKS